MNELALNCAVSEVLSVEILRPVPHSVSCVSCHWEFKFWVVWKSSLIPVFCGEGCVLEPIWHRLELWKRSHVFLLQSRPQWIQIEEGVFSVVYCHCGSLVPWPETLVTHCRHVEINISPCYFNSCKPISEWVSRKFYKYSASVKLAASLWSLISAGQLASLSLLKFPLLNSFPFCVVNLSLTGREAPWMNSLLMELPVTLANDFPKRFSDLILGT